MNNLRLSSLGLVPQVARKQAGLRRKRFPAPPGAQRT